MLDKNQILKLAAIIFGIVALFHLLRSIFSWELLLDQEMVIPLYFSYIAFIVTGYLSCHMYNASKK